MIVSALKKPQQDEQIRTNEDSQTVSEEEVTFEQKVEHKLLVFERALQRVFSPNPSSEPTERCKCMRKDPGQEDVVPLNSFNKGTINKGME